MSRGCAAVLACLGGVYVEGPALLFYAYHCLGEIPGSEGDEVIHLFAHPYVPDGYAKAVGYGENEASFCGAVELRDDDPGHGKGLVEFFSLGNGVQVLMALRVSSLLCVRSSNVRLRVPFNDRLGCSPTNLNG